eukprot:6191018-Pleurochrysis_carterae.AAC.3
MARPGGAAGFLASLAGGVAADGNVRGPPAEQLSANAAADVHDGNATPLVLQLFAPDAGDLMQLLSTSILNPQSQPSAPFVRVFSGAAGCLKSLEANGSDVAAPHLPVCTYSGTGKRKRTYSSWMG